MPSSCDFPQTIQADKITGIEGQERSALLDGVEELIFIRETLVSSARFMRTQYVVFLLTEGQRQGGIDVLVAV
jgi:hypothetical protein